MTRYLLDTSVASVLAPGRRREGAADQTVEAWLEGHEPDMHLSVMTLLEIESGIQRLAVKGATRRIPELSRWLAGLIELFGDRILPVDTRVAIAAGRIEAAAFGKGLGPGLADIVIAATGEVHALTILTRNLRHFAPLGVASVDPFTRQA